jgi:hypothetical protein
MRETEDALAVRGAELDLEVLDGPLTAGGEGDEFLKDGWIQAEGLEDGFAQHGFAFDAKDARDGRIDIEEAAGAITEKDQVRDFVEETAILDE